MNIEMIYGKISFRILKLEFVHEKIRNSFFVFTFSDQLKSYSSEISEEVCKFQISATILRPEIDLINIPTTNKEKKFVKALLP